MHANIDGIYPLSPLQQGLLFHSVSQPQSTEYFIQVRLEFRGALNLRAFEAAWADMLQRHTILRTAFAWEGLDTPLQVVQRQVSLPLTIEDWRHRDEADVETLLQQDAGEGFNLEQAPLMRWRLLQLDDRRWQLLWSYHHLLLDGWSVGLLMADWLNRYRHHDGESVPALPAPTPFCDYVAWLDQQDVAQAESFWRSQLGDFASPTPLPRLDPALAPISGLPYAERTAILDGDLWQALRRFCQDQGLTLNTLLQGAWGVLLGSLAGRREALFGVTVSGRPDDLAGADAMVGLFINTLPLRLEWDGETTLADWLARLHALNGELHHYEYTPLIRLKALSRIPGDAALFETIFVFENFPFDGNQTTLGDRLALQPLEEGRVVDGIRQTRGRNNYPLSLIASVENDGLQLLLSYRRQRFSDATAALLLRHLQQLLQAFATQPDRAITELNWLDPQDRQKQRQWGRGAEWPLPAGSVADWFADQAGAHPDRAAVADRERCLTYAELDAAANRLARDYRELGLQSGDTLALALPRSVDFVAALIAALKAGLTYVPLDSGHPALRQAAIVEDSDARVVLCTAALAPALGEALAALSQPVAVTLVELDGRRDRIAALSDAPLAPVPAGATAYLVYTSGSTGALKGVAVSHRALLAYTLGILRELSLPAGCRFASVSTLAADLGYTQLFGALLGGGYLYLVDDDTRFDPAALAATLEQQRIDVLKLTPSHLHGLLAARPDARLLPRHTLLLGGEALETSLLAQVRALAPNLAVYNHYGPSEATVGALLHAVDLDAACLPDAPSQVPLGRPQPNRLARVLDPQGRELPTGVPGELCLGGEGLADGYHRRPALTETHFFTLPNTTGRLYRTGDRVRWLANGELMFLGRLDNQVKVRGYRVEPDEVAFHLKRLSERIRQAVVHLWQDGIQAPRLVAYLVAEGDLNTRKLHHDLSLHLPDYMVPGDFVLLDRIPVTGNGKVDYRRLPAPPSDGAPGAGHQPPRTATETALAEVWRAVLQRDVIGVHDHFFALGGDSIMLLQVIARARQQGMALTPALAFEHRTIAALAAVIDGAFSDTPETTATDGDRPALPLSPGQHYRLASPPLQASWRLLRLHRPLDRQTLATALGALRQHYYSFTGAVPLIEPTDAEMADPAPLASTLFSAMQAPDDHAGQPWLAAAVTDMHLLLCAHPLGLDGAGWPLLLRELALAYGQAGSPPAFSSSGRQLLRYLEAQQRRAQSDELEPAWEYWLEHAGLELPVLNLEDAPPENSPLPLTAATRTAISILLERHAVTPLTLITAALASLLCARLRSDTVVVAVSGGRPALAELPPTAPLSRTGIDPGALLGALDFPVPVILQGLCADPLSGWRQVQRQLAELPQACLPQAGADYGLLRYLSDNAWLREPLLSLPCSQAWIRWLGDWDGDAALGTVVRHHEPAPGDFPLVVSVYRQGGALQAEISAGRDWAEQLAETLSALVAAIGLDAPPRAEAFPLCPDRKALAELPVDWQQVEDLYPLTPMQHGMMIHSLRSAEAAYLSQTRLQWDGPLNRDALEQAWGQLIARHPILRTTFVWRHAEQPLQCVHRRIDRHFFWEDLGDLPSDRQQRYIDSLLAQERAEPRPLDQPPLTWLRVLRLSERRFVLCHSIHHALSDAWTFGLLMDELLQRYGAFMDKRPPVLAPARPFHHYLRWLGHQDPAAAREFWQRTLAGFDAPTPLPFTGLEQDPPVKSPRRHLALGVADTQRLQRFCQQQQITVNTLVQGAWALLLARCNDCNDVTFGISVAGRPADLEGADTMRGVFIQTLPLRVAVDDRMALRDWLHALLNHNLELRRHEHLPLTEIQRCSDVDATLFDSVLVFANAPLDDALTTRLPGCRIDFIEDWVQTHYPLLIDVLPGSQLELQLTFDPARFQGSAADRTLFHLQALIQAMIARPDVRLGELDLLTAPERQRLDDFNRTENAFADWGYPLKSSYPELFARQVRRNPDKTAAVCRGVTLSFRELDRRSNRLARALAAAGARPERLVALLAERDLPLLDAMIATFKTGAAYLPLDPNLPQARLQQLLDLSEAPVLAASSHCRELAAALVAQQAAGRPTTLCIIEEHWLDGDDTPLPLRSTPECLAYVIFTSGSTGTPKGAMVEQRGMLNNMFGHLLSLGLSADDRVAQTASQAFDISVWQFLAAPLIGATVHVLPDEVTRDPAALLRAVDEQGITLMELVPTQIRTLLGAAGDAALLRSLRWLQSIGEALPAVLVRDWLKRFPSVPLLNAYGPAECSDNVACFPITEIPADLHRPIPIGRPTANNQLYILDSARRRQPVGVPGEICAAGVSVGRGYWRDLGQTAEVFAEHPFAPGQRFYRTGDIGRWREDGTIEYLGRLDFQCKLRGQRIEPGEIEAHLELLDGVDTAAVVAVPSDEGSQYLVAYWTGPEDVSDGVLRRALARRLPAHMVPSLFVRLDALPQNRNGKVDRKALAQRPVHFARHDGQAPRNGTERQLAAIWKELLPAAAFGVDDNFFSLGGHSLLATQVLSRIRQNLGVELPLNTLFERSTIALLAEAVDAAQRAGGETAIFDIPRVSRDKPLPLSYAQQRLWFLDQLEGASGAYNIPAVVKLRGALNTEALKAAVDTLLQRHESLRTCFGVEGDSPRQIIVENCKAEIAFHDLSQHQSVQSLIDEEAERPFDLGTAPMLRVVLQRLSENTHVLQFTLHHIAADAWSLGILMREFIHCYQAFAADTAPALPPLPIQYADYAHWQRSERQRGQLARDLDYWRRQLQGVPAVIKLPLDGERPAQPDYRGAAFNHTLPAAQVQALKTYGQSHRATLFMVLLNAFNSLLQRATGENEFIVGTDVANREHPALEGLIGFFVNVLPLRARLNDRENFTERLETLRDTTLEAYQHQRAPFDKLVEVVQPPRQSGVNPLVQVLFVMQNTPKADVALEGLDVEELSPLHETSKFDLAVFLEENEKGEITARWLYRTSLFHPGTVENLKQGFQSLVEQVANNPALALTQWQWSLTPSKPKASRKNAKLSKLKGARPTLVSHAPQEQIKTSTLASALPLIVEPRLAELDPLRWAQQSRQWIETQLQKHGGLLFRGFNLPDAAAFEQFAQAIEPSLYGNYGDLPKNTSGNNIYHSTPYPEQQMILYHNESSHMAQWPRKQWFFCELPARRGGCTPIVDCREVYRRLPPEILAPLEQKGLRYVRHFTDRLDVKWQDFFKTDDPRQVEAQCHQQGMRWKWLDNDGLRIEQHGPAVITHPDTGEKSFFNQVQLHHESCLEPEVRRNLHHLFGPDQLPRNVYYGDGSTIADAVMEEIDRIYEACAVRFDWQKRDVVMLDNMLVAHARDPFEGERRICVAMAQMVRRQDTA